MILVPNKCPFCNSILHGFGGKYKFCSATELETGKPIHDLHYSDIEYIKNIDKFISERIYIYINGFSMSQIYTNGFITFSISKNGILLEKINDCDIVNNNFFEYLKRNGIVN